MADLDTAAVQVARQLVETTPDDHPNRAARIRSLALQLGERFGKTAVRADIDEAVYLSRESIDRIVDKHDRAKHLDTLGTHLSQRYLQTGDASDLEEAIQVSEQAIEACERSMLPQMVQIELDTRLTLEIVWVTYIRAGALGDLEEAIQVMRQAATHGANDNTEKAMYLTSLGNKLADRFERTGHIEDLDEAIQVSRQAVKITPSGPARATYLSNLANQLDDRYLRKGTVDDLKEAITIANQAVSCATAGPSRAIYSRVGDMGDLDEAIRFAWQAVDLTPNNHPDRVKYLDNLGSRLGDRYIRTEAISELEESIQIARRVVKSTPKDHPDLPRYLGTLSARLDDKHIRTGATLDLEEAIQLSKQIIGATSDDHPNRTMYLSNLGNQLNNKYSRTKSMSDLDEAIRVTRQAVDSIPKDRIERAAVLRNLSVQLGDRFESTSSLNDIEEAIQVAREAVYATPLAHPDRASCMVSLGYRLEDRDNTEDRNDVDEAIVLYQGALQLSSSTLITRIEAGQALLHCSSDWEQCYEAAKLAVSLIRGLTLRSLENSDRRHLLRQVVGLASDAAAVALRADKGPLAALDLLEQGRGVLWASVEEIRADILPLQERNPELARAFIRLREELETPPSVDTNALDGPDKASWLAKANRRYDAGKEFDKLVDEIRKLAGFEGFLGLAKETDIKAAASHGPIAVINISEYGCDAILIEQDQLKVVELSSLSEEQVAERANNGDLGHLGVLEWLWETITEPILEALGFDKPPDDAADWPHIWWIPTGSLTRFPLHAAGYHRRQSSEAVLDRAMSSYSTSIKAIIDARRRNNTPTAARALFVAMENTPESTPLRFANEEVATVKTICRSIPLDAVEPGRRREDVTSYLRDCRVFHFAGHGYTDTEDPAKSHFRLEDWKDNPLTVADLLEMNLREHSPFLAYLSACGTGQVKDERYIDESVHLINACQLAGFRHVIGTLWEVSDTICIDMARITYEVIRDGGMTDESVCRGLHMASRALRDTWRSGSFLGNKDASGANIGTQTHRRPKRLPRDASLLIQRDKVAPLHWVPFYNNLSL
ncbi:uncharacterized protein K444DRAFT_661309 [Hyaloscypha bicolor E]|uniref:CHAT domain-containing protein n=1 Tax=Hyaloscypha bicolor E TaxID=1095630 RepID=A0A2J6TJT9_9HELO|nr:uncharacterized protein K444DRAFT_661309 [Hyaloscypha bicolor E]PMD63284.1 hypothetical protein K444DRAFT_661309 [Hyaloscypha bicolor E]